MRGREGETEMRERQNSGGSGSEATVAAQTAATPIRSLSLLAHLPEFRCSLRYLSPCSPPPETNPTTTVFISSDGVGRETVGDLQPISGDMF
ncbi:hypothetical protein HanIR_Chr01g0005971 [Helianthus annuus]|nr:hypothetical protein HanIR_Chr01g0005971 [Helianthus annuus]